MPWTEETHIDADGWTEQQIQDFLKLQEAGLIDEWGNVTSKGQAVILGTLGNPPEIDFTAGRRVICEYCGEERIRWAKYLTPQTEAFI